MCTSGMCGATPFLDAAHFPDIFGAAWKTAVGICAAADSDWVMLSLLVVERGGCERSLQCGLLGFGCCGNMCGGCGIGGKCFVRTGPLCGEVHVAVDFSSSGSGTVSAEGGGDALSDGGEVRQGATVMFTATPAAGHYVSGWSGNCAEIGEIADGLDGTAKVCAAAADSDLSVRAEFSEIPSLAGPLCPSGSLTANGLTQAELNAGLVSAAQANNLEDVCEHLRRGASVEAQEQSGTYRRTALMIAAYDRYLELAKLLHANGADVNSRVGNGGMGGRANPGRWRTHGDSGFTALMYAAGAAGAAGAATAAGRAEMIGWLLDNGADPNLGDSRGRLPLFEAAFYGRVDVMGLLLDGGADVDGTDVWGLTPLHAAGPHYNYGSGPEWSYAATVAGYLLSRGADVNALDSWGRSPLDMYAEWSHPNAAAVLRNAGGKCFVRTGPLCGVDVAVDFSSSGSGTVSAEGDGGALSDGDDVRQGATVMFTATPAAGHYVSGWSGNCAEVGEVADGLDGAAKFCAAAADSDLSVRAEFSEIPSLAGPLCESGSLSANGLTQAQLDAGLISAAEDNDLEGACEYLRRGANVDARESGRYYKRTALMIAANDGFLDLAKLLHANGADVNLHGGSHDGGLYARGWSALMYAAVAGNVEIARLLLDAGAEIESVWDGGGKTALWEASYWGRPGIVELLLSRGADVLGGIPGDLSGIRAAVRETTVNYPYTRTMLSYYYPKPSSDSLLLVVSLLASGGAELNERRRGGRSILDEAVNRNNARVAKVLRQFGGKCFLATGPLCGIPEVAVEYAVIPADESGGTVSAKGDDGALSHEDEVRQGTTLTFTATPASGWMLSAWGGDAADCSGLVCALAADSDLSVHAEFSPILSLTDLSCPAGTLPTNGLTAAELNMTLRMAARGGDATRACEALRRGAEVNDNLDDSEFTPLQEAVSGGHLEAAKVLLANGAEVNKRKDGAGHSPLDLAARDGEAEIAALLRNADGRCFLETGPLCRNVPVATPDPVTVVNTVAATVVATVANTVVAEVENTVASTVAAGSCPAGTLPTNGLTQAQLDYEFLGAVLENDLEGACEYLRRGANIEIREDEVGRPYNLSALMIAAGRGGYNYPDMTRLLLSNGADPDSKDGHGWVTALHYAAASGHTETAALLLDWGGDVNVLSSGGDPPLYQAAHWGRADMVRLLLSRGADPDIQANTGVTPLHGAASNVAQSGSAAVVSLLLSYDADPNLRRSLPNPGFITRAGETGHSPLDDLVARGYGNYAEAARILRDAGGKCFVRTSSLCQNVPVATPDPVTVVNTVAATVVLPPRLKTQSPPQLRRAPARRERCRPTA